MRWPREAVRIGLTNMNEQIIAAMDLAKAVIEQNRIARTIKPRQMSQIYWPVVQHLNDRNRHSG
jgi:hypothetical protein